MNSFLDFRWSEEPLNDVKSVGSVPFTDENCASLGGFELLDSNEVDALMGTPQDVNLNSSIDDIAGLSTQSNSNYRKRTLANVESQSDSATASNRRKKPKGMPKRPLSSYNLFFQSERAKLLSAAKMGGVKIGFEGLAKIIGTKWREIDAVEHNIYEKLAEKDSIRYLKEIEAYTDVKSTKDDEDDKQKPSRTTYDPSPSPGVDQVEAAVALRKSSYPGDTLPVFQEGPIRSSSSHPEDYSRPPVPTPSQPQNTQHYFYSENPPVAEAPRYQQSPYVTEIGVQLNQFPALNAPGAQYISLPPPPAGAEPIIPPRNCPMPPGMEIYLNNRRYLVQYSCYSMRRDEAHKYIKSLGAVATGGAPAPA